MMRRRVTILGCGLLASSVGATQAIAEPCVGEGFDRVFPGATEVQTRYVDVPSPRFPGLWQEGRIGGFIYEIYANGDATVTVAGDAPPWMIAVRCDLEAKSCGETIEGTPPADGLRIAGLMKQCFLSPDTVVALAAPAPEPPVIAPQTDGWALAPPEQPAEGVASEGPLSEDIAAEGTLADDGAAEAPVLGGAPPPLAPCGLAAIEQGSTGITLQRLLVAAGTDPGPIDGLPGRLTRSALAQVLGAGSSNLGLDAAVAALDTYLCDAAAN